jgi:hypothetical protein
MKVGGIGILADHLPGMGGKMRFFTGRKMRKELTYLIFLSVPFWLAGPGFVPGLMFPASSHMIIILRGGG